MDSKGRKWPGMWVRDGSVGSVDMLFTVEGWTKLELLEFEVLTVEEDGGWQNSSKRSAW